MELKYEYVKKIGGGATCETFLVKHKDMNQYRILKKLPVTQQNRKCFDMEVEVLKRIKGKGIPVLYDLEISEEGLLIVEEYIDGNSLDNLLEEGSIDANTAVKYVISVCNILYSLHQKEIVYLDMKPEHIIISHGEVYLIDYGNCATTGSRNISMLSEKYAAPEQFHGETVGVFSDIYSIGVLLMDIRRCFDPRENISGELEAVIEKCMSTLPEDRFSDILQLIAELELFLDETQHISRTQWIRKDIQMRRRIGKRIYVYGIREHSGCTHLALALANYLSKTCGKTEYISEGSEDSFVSMMNNRVLKRNKDGEFMYGDVLVKNNQWRFIQEQEVSRFCVVDRGCIPGGQADSGHETEDGTGIVVISGVADWENRDYVYNKIQVLSEQWGDRLLIILNLVSRDGFKKINRFMGRNLIRMPLFENPLQTSGETERFLKQIIRKMDIKN